MLPTFFLGIAVAITARAHGAIVTVVTLNVEPFRLIGPENTATFWTRAYNAPAGPEGQGRSLPMGPTIRIRAGDTLNVTINNNLGHNDPPYDRNQNESLMRLRNKLHSPNTTNLHTHGLHIGSQLPADDVLWFPGILPNTSYTQSYILPPDHQGGTHWYHAHHHGSTALQAGGGLAGVLIVEDARDAVPPEVLGLPERILMLMHIAPHNLYRIASESNDTLTTRDFENRSSDDCPFVLCNGDFQPQINLTQGVNYRLRMVYSSVDMKLNLSIIADAEALGCTWELLAKDGMYVSPAPRAVGNVYLAPGNRADVIIRCDRAGNGSIVSGNTDSRRRRHEEGALPCSPESTATHNVTLAYLTVLPSAVAADTSIVRFQAKRPAYLADLTNYNGTMAPYAVIFSPGGGGCLINNLSFQGQDSPIAQIAVGAIHNWTVDDNDHHPFHLHINPYQLVNVSDNSGWFQEGDWQDVTLLPRDDSQNPTVTIGTYRFATDRFIGTEVLHCHFLEHEDLGCMASVNITGVSGTQTPLQGTPLVILRALASGASGDDDDSRMGTGVIVGIVASVLAPFCLVIYVVKKRMSRKAASPDVAGQPAGLDQPRVAGEAMSDLVDATNATAAVPVDATNATAAVPVDATNATAAVPKEQQRPGHKKGEYFVRSSVRALQDQYDKGDKTPLQDLVRAWKGITEDGSFFKLGGFHGEPWVLRPDADKYAYWGGYCNHGNILFPTWHRVYCYKIEQELQRIVPGVTLPFWDESSEASKKHGIPSVLTDEEFELDDGTKISNPLRSFTLPKGISDGLPGDDQRYAKPKGYKTVRYPLSGLVGTETARKATLVHNLQYPNHVENVKKLNENVCAWMSGSSPTPENPNPIGNGTTSLFKKCLDAPNYTVFSNKTSTAEWNANHEGQVTALEDPHNDIHLAVGGFDGGSGSQKFESGQIAEANGDMGENNTAGFDPIFFFHHCNIDRMFWLWQKRHKQTTQLEVTEDQKSYPGTSSSDDNGPTPGVAPGTVLSLDKTSLAPFRKADLTHYTSKDCIDIEGQLGYTYGPGSHDDDGAVEGMNVREGSSKPKLTVSGIDRALFTGSFVLRAYATVQSVDGGSTEYYLGHHSVLSRHNVVKCANCMTHQEVIAHFPLHALPESQVDAAQFRVAIQHRGAALPAASDATATPMSAAKENVAQGVAAGFGDWADANHDGTTTRSETAAFVQAQTSPAAAADEPTLAATGSDAPASTLPAGLKMVFKVGP